MEIEYPSLPVYVYLFPLLAALGLLEVTRHRSATGRPYPAREAAASLAVFAISVAETFLPAFVQNRAFDEVFRYRITTLSTDSWIGWVGLFLALEFAYYWMHRCSHTIRWMWASHAVHHTPDQLNFAAAARIPVTAGLSGMWLFWVPLVWIGFDPFKLFLLLGLNQAYQVWIHTEVIGKLGPLEWFLNTPSHHRVHHAVNDEYRDRNFGGTLITFDRMFGTFAEEREGVLKVYGLVNPVQSRNPFVLIFHEWVRIAHDLRSATSWRGRFRAAFGSIPGHSVLPMGEPRRSPHLEKLAESSNQ